MMIKGNEGEGNNKGNSTHTESVGGTKSEEITDKEGMKERWSGWEGGRVGGDKSGQEGG